jgi:hypothetical protein
MAMSVFEMWLYLVVLPGLKTVGEFASVVACFAFVVLLVITGLAYDTGVPGEKEAIKARFVKYFKIIGGAAGIAIVIVITVPSEKQLWTIAAAHLGTTAEGAEKLPDEMVKALRAMLERAADD